MHTLNSKIPPFRTSKSQFENIVIASANCSFWHYLLSGQINQKGSEKEQICRGSARNITNAAIVLCLNDTKNSLIII